MSAKMLRVALLLPTLGAAAQDARKLSFESMVGYEPSTDVSQHSYIDKDQKELEANLKKAGGPDWAAAKEIYTKGGNSGATAVMTVSALGAALSSGGAVEQNGINVGYMKKAAGIGATSITVTYTGTCREGGLAVQDLSGCFTVGGGDLSVAGSNIGVPTLVTNKYRTLAGFSTAAETKMMGQEFFVEYRAYWGSGDYANKRVMAGLDGDGICSSCDDAARVEIVKKTTAYMNVWMYVIREMEDAIHDCQNGCTTTSCNDDPVHAWDEAVAFYAGSLELGGGTADGSLLHQLADKRCVNFGTCVSGSTGGSKVNQEILRQFKLAQDKLLKGKCIEVVPIKRRIVELMSVPLLQGALRYAYKVGELGQGSKAQAEGAAFSAAILPRVAACDPSQAAVIASNMNIEVASKMSSGFEDVKEAFEATYACMGVTCEDVGGLVVTGTEYYDKAGPCTVPQPEQTIVTTTEEADSTLLVVVCVVGIVLVCAMGGVAVFFSLRASKYQKLAEGRANGAGGSPVGKAGF